MDTAELSQASPRDGLAFAELFDSSLLPVVIRTPDELVYANQRWADLLGDCLQDHRSGPMEAFFSIDGDDPAFDQHSLPSSDHPLYRYTVRRNGGGSISLQVVGNPIEWLGQEAVCETVVSHSCSDEADRAIGALGDGAKQRFFEALDGFSEGFVLFDSDERLIIYNKKYLDIYPTLKDVLKPGETMLDILRTRVERGLVPEAAGREEAWIEERMEKLRSPGGVYDVRSDDDRWLHTRQQRTADGGTLVTVIDITDRKAMEVELERHRDHLEDLVQERTEQLEQALNKERELNGLQRQFVSMVSHEFRTPLAIIDGTAQLLLRRPEKANPERLTDALKKVRTSVGRLTGLIETVLDAARLEEGRIKFEPEALAIRDVLEGLQRAYLETSPNHRIEANLNGLPDQIEADERLIRQIFSNLISNAVKYSPDGTAVHIRGWHDGKKVMVSVQDNGVGIPRDELANLFERFFRASTSTGIAGTGIGLHLTQHFIHLHGGSIEVESVVGTGSTFTVHLPIEQEKS